MIREARASDTAAIAAAFARAYADDVLMAWFAPGGRDRTDRLRRMFAASIRPMIAARLRHVLTTDDLAGAAFWAAPGTCRLPTARMLPSAPGVFAALGPRGFVRSARTYAFLQSHHPVEAHWFLESIAVDPPRQRRGIGRALIEPVLHTCDRDGVDAYLETQDPANVPYYERYGFAVSGEADVPGGGPRMWLMTRRPR